MKSTAYKEKMSTGAQEKLLLLLAPLQPSK